MTQLPTTKRVLSKAWIERGVPDAIKWEVLAVEDGDIVDITFENSEPTEEGIWLCSDQGLMADNVIYPQVLLWQGTAPKSVRLVVHCTDGRLHLYNVWRDECAHESTGSQAYSSGMLCETSAMGSRYRCNSVGFENPFAGLVFTVRTRSEYGAGT